MVSDPKLVDVASLWIGGSLSVLDQTCLMFFIKHGHRVVLYHYYPLENIPAEVETRDAREIYPNEDILIHRNGSPAMHADIFRLHLMAKTDFVWIDTDIICLRPFERETYVVPYETATALTNCVLRLPKDSPALSYMLEFVEDRYPVPPWVLRAVRMKLNAARREGNPIHVTQQKFTTFGPSLLKYALNQSGELSHAKPPHVYLPLPSTKHRFIVKDKHRDTILNDMIKPDTKGMHLWSTVVRKNGWLEKIESESYLAMQAKEVGISLGA